MSTISDDDSIATLMHDPVRIEEFVIYDENALVDSFYYIEIISVIQTCNREVPVLKINFCHFKYDGYHFCCHQYSTTTRDAKIL